MKLPTYEEFLNEAYTPMPMAKLKSYDPAAFKLTKEFVNKLSFGDKLNSIDLGFYSGRGVPEPNTLMNEIKKNFKVSMERTGEYYVAYKTNVFHVQPVKYKTHNYVQISYSSTVDEFNDIADYMNAIDLKNNRKPRFKYL